LIHCAELLFHLESAMSHDAASRSVESVAREAYAQLLSFVAARAGGDVASAEDALAEAFLTHRSAALA